MISLVGISECCHGWCHLTITKLYVLSDTPLHGNGYRCRQVDITAAVGCNCRMSLTMNFVQDKRRFMLLHIHLPIYIILYVPVLWLLTAGLLVLVALDEGKNEDEEGEAAVYTGRD